MTSEHLPSDTVVVHSEQPYHALEVVVDERVVKLRVRLFHRVRHDTVAGKELEIRAERRVHRLRVDSQAAEVAQNKAEQRTSRNVETKQAVLGMGFKDDAVVQRRRDNCFTRKAQITIIEVRLGLG
jgi:hypothetical protein